MFEVVNNPEKRDRYNRYGHAGLEGNGSRFHDVNDIFRRLQRHVRRWAFWRPVRRAGGRRGRLGRERMSVPMWNWNCREAASGATKTIHFDRHEFCSTCHGSGAKPGTQPERCRYCGGRGTVVQSSGIFSVQTTCPSCRGAGSTIRDACIVCRGTGAVQKRVTREVPIPAGVDDGTRLRIPGEGEPSPEGGSRGDCYVFIKVKEHPFFHRQGQHLLCQVPIGFTQAALARGSRSQPWTARWSWTSREERKAEAISSSRDAGCRIPARGRGDLIVQVFIEVPKRLTPEHERILGELPKSKTRMSLPSARVSSAS